MIDLLERIANRMANISKSALSVTVVVLFCIVIYLVWQIWLYPIFQTPAIAQETLKKQTKFGMELASQRVALDRLTENYEKLSEELSKAGRAERLWRRTMTTHLNAMQNNSQHNGRLIELLEKRLDLAPRFIGPLRTLPHPAGVDSTTLPD